jgi:hypothetical protein
VAFRDDREALAEKAAVLERELRQANETLASQREAIDQVTTLQASVRELSSERDRLRGTLGPREMRRRWMLFAIVLAALVYAGIMVRNAHTERDAEIETARARTAAVETELATARRQAEEQRSRADAADARATTAEHALARAQQADDDALADAMPRTTRTLAGTVAFAPRDTNVSMGTPCAITIDRGAPDCTVHIECGSHDVYRSVPGTPLTCTTDAQGGWRAIDPSRVDGSPRLDVQTSRHLVRVATRGGQLLIALTSR